MWCFFCHEMIFVILYPAINFITSRIPTVKNCVSRSREDDFIPRPASNFLCISHPASILSPIPHPAKPMLDPPNCSYDKGKYEEKGRYKRNLGTRLAKLSPVSSLETTFTQRSKMVAELTKMSEFRSNQAYE